MHNTESERIGFVATRFVGNDGVSLESKKWAEILEEMGHQIFWYAGKLDRPRESSYCIPEAHFTHAENEWISERIWGNTCRDALITKRIRDMAEYLKGTLHSFIEHYDISILIFENTLSMPMNIPLGIAITELLNETEISAIAHHHDFYWERPRYAVTAVHDFLEMAFPPRDEDLVHVVVNKKSLQPAYPMCWIFIRKALNLMNLIKTFARNWDLKRMIYSLCSLHVWCPAKALRMRSGLSQC